METYLKCLLKCAPRIDICEANLKPIITLSKFSKKLSTLYAKAIVYCVKKHTAEDKALYSQARIFIGYDRALEGGRDQDWWFKQANDMMNETIEYWSGSVPKRVAYLMSMDDPMRFPMTYVFWKNRLAIYTARSFLTKNKYWILACLVLGVI